MKVLLNLPDCHFVDSGHFQVRFITVCLSQYFDTVDQEYRYSYQPTLSTHLSEKFSIVVMCRFDVKESHNDLHVIKEPVHHIEGATEDVRD